MYSSNNEVRNFGGKKRKFKPKLYAALKLLTTHTDDDNLGAMNEYRRNRLSSVVQSYQSQKQYYLSQKNLVQNL